jgi:hypothetical protein
MPLQPTASPTKSSLHSAVLGRFLPILSFSLLSVPVHPSLDRPYETPLH